MPFYRRRGVQSGLVLLALMSLARADGLPAGPGSPSSAGADWSGLYVGAQGGGAWTQTGWTFPVDSYFTLPTGRRSFDTDPSGGFMGGHVTWNHQIDALVIGAELAVNGGAIEQTQIGVFTPLFSQDRFFSSITAFGTLVGRLGYAYKNVLIYTTGGFARGNATFRAVSAPPGGGVVGNIKQTLNGFTFGGGVEYMLFENVVIGGAYDFIRLDGATSGTATTGTPSSDPYVFSSRQVDINTVSLRLSLKLGQPPPAP